MGFNHNAGPQGPVGQMPPPGSMAPAPTEWQEFGAQRFKKKGKGKRTLLAILAVITLVLVVLSGLRISMLSGNTGNQLVVHIASQQDAVIDLRQSVAISPYLYGANVLPKIGSDSADAANTGVMPYSSQLAQGLQTMGIKMLSYPGGAWGQQHALSDAQLNDFNQMLSDTKTSGMLQVPLNGNDPATLATQWVQTMKSVKFWTIGSEPDLTMTADQYAQTFIQLSTKMHQANPSIKVFGPQVSSYFDVNTTTTSADGHAWMDEFLQKVGTFEKQNCGPGKQYSFYVLDGVSFHYYPHTTPFSQPSLLLSSGNEWDYILPGLRSQINSSLGRDVPIAITELNTNPAIGADGTPQAKIAPAYASLWLADTLGTLMNDQVQYASFYSASPSVMNPTPLFALDGSETSMGRVYELFTHLQDQVVPLTIQDDPLSVFATTDKGHKTVSLLFINKTPLPQRAQINPSTLITSEGSWPSQDVKVAPYGLAVVTLHRDSAQAEGYAFVPPSKADGMVNPVSSAICGARPDPVVTSVAC
jgi:hypothetical protein